MAAHETAAASRSGHEPGEPSSATAGDELAGLWLSALEGLAAQAAHEVANAFNALSMNVEVVRMLARPGGEAGKLAPFGAAAGEALGEAMALCGALVGLSRTARDPGATDVRGVLTDAGAILGAVARARQRVGFAVETGGDAAPTGADLRAVRLAVVSALTDGLGAADARVRAVEAGGSELADELSSHVRGTLSLDAEGAPVLHVTPGVLPAPAVSSALARAGVTAEVAGGGLVLRFTPA